MSRGWKGIWIGAPQFKGITPQNLFHKQMAKISIPEHRRDLQNHHLLVRKTFLLPTSVIETAYLNITADDYYKLWINGRFVGQGPAPGYFDHYYYNRYEVAQYLNQGLNVIAVHLYYQGLINRVWTSGDYRQGMIAELQIGEAVVLATDGSWKCSLAREFIGGEPFGYETQFVENIDNRLSNRGWRKVDYDDEHWCEVVENPEDDHQLVLQETPPLQIYELKPIRVDQLEPGCYLVDFGQEITGQFTMDALGHSGQQVEIRYGEELMEGSGARVRYLTRCNCNYRDLWILNDGLNTLEQYDYKAFRYVELITSADVKLATASFSAIVRHYPLDETKCSFRSSDQLLNQIWAICKNGVKYGAQEVFVDCPSREKGQYLGDATVTSHAHLYLSGDLRLSKKQLREFALSSRICPGLMAVAPCSFMQEIADFSLQWPLQLLEFYRQSGDLAFLQEMMPVAEGIIRYFKNYQRSDGLLENVKEKWNLVDWPENLRDGYDFDLTQPVVGNGCHNVLNAFFCGAVKAVNTLRDILKLEYSDEFPRLRQAFINAFYRPDCKRMADSDVSDHTALHSNTVALFFDLVPKEAYSSIVRLIRNKRLNCGVYQAYFLLKGLARIGEYTLVYQLLTGNDDHSWANMIREEATTCFETWGKAQKWNTSLCHPWASAPIPVLIEDICGLNPARPGWTEVRFEPHIPETLDDLELSFWTVRGKIRVCAQKGQITRLELPKGVSVIS